MSSVNCRHFWISKEFRPFFADICADIYNCQKRLGLFCEGPFSYFNSWIKVIELKAIQRNQKQLRLKPNSPFHQRNCPSSYSEILHFSSSELWKIKYKSWILNSQKKYFIGVFLKSLPNENEPERWVLLPWKMFWKPVLQPIKTKRQFKNANQNLCANSLIAIVRLWQ